MATIARTASQISPSKPIDAEIHDFRCSVAIDHQVVYQVTATGRVALASAAANDALARPLGIALSKKGISDVVSVLKRGFCPGFDLSGMAVNDLIYLSDTAGELSTTAGTISTIVGKVFTVPDDPGGQTLIAYFDFGAQWIR